MWLRIVGIMKTIRANKRAKDGEAADLSTILRSVILPDPKMLIMML